MNLLGSLLLAAVMVRTGLPANLVTSTYLKDGFTPTAIASDSQGNIYLAGSAVIDAASQATGAVVAKLDPKATQYLYLAYLDSGGSDRSLPFRCAAWCTISDRSSPIGCRSCDWRWRARPRPRSAPSCITRRPR